MHVFISLHTLFVMPSLAQCEEFIVKIAQNRVLWITQNPPPKKIRISHGCLKNFGPESLPPIWDYSLMIFCRGLVRADYYCNNRLLL